MLGDLSKGTLSVKTPAQGFRCAVSRTKYL